MKAKSMQAEFDQDKYYEVSSRRMRWVCLVLVALTFPFTSRYGLVVLTVLLLTAAYNALRYSSAVRRLPFFRSRMNALAVDHVFVLFLVVVSGGLASPYYTLFFLLIVAVIASYGVAGFAFSLSAQVLIALLLLTVHIQPSPAGASFQLIIKLVVLIAFGLVAEQSVRSRGEDYLLAGRFTRRAENERQRLLSLINSLSNAVLAADSHGKVYLYNAAALELLNTNRDITGTTIGTLLPLKNARGTKVNLLKLATDQDRTINRQDLHYQATDGSKMNLDLTVSPVHGSGYETENVGGYMVVFRDITKQKSLDDERDEFISVTSHELRTPLAIAEANLSTAILPGFAKIEPKALTLLGQAHDNIVFLSELIQDLTTLSRAERGDLVLERTLVDTQSFAEQLVRDYRAQARDKDLDIVLDAGPDLGALLTSEPELREILQNFVTNAIKYTTSGMVTVEVKRVPTGTRFLVHDTGIGIAASDKSKIFTKFYRSEDYRTRQTTGTGLGLYITHKLAEKMRIKLSFTSRLNHGSTFGVTVPSELSEDDADQITPSVQSQEAVE